MEAPPTIDERLPLPEPWEWTHDIDDRWCAVRPLPGGGRIKVYEASDPPGDEIAISVKSLHSETHAAPVAVIVAVAMANRA